MPAAPRDIVEDVMLCLAFYTRLPLPVPDGAGRAFAAAQWAAPLAGAAVGVAAAAAYALLARAGLPAAPAALAAIGVGMLATGALHEDGLADTADGFGGGTTPERRMEIMRDSRVGTYGALALTFSLLFRASAVASLAAPGLVLLALPAAHAAARSLLPAFMRSVPPARSDGLSAGVGAVPAAAARISLGLGALALVVALGIPGALAAAIALGIAFWWLRRACLARIGGQTGDVLGALEQVAESTVLAVACLVFI